MTGTARPNAKAPHSGCAICGQPIGHGWLMCPRHWATVPKPLQHQVTRTWGRLSRLQVGSAESKGALADYRKARDAAISAASDQSPQQSATETP